MINFDSPVIGWILPDDGNGFVAYQVHNVWRAMAMVFDFRNGLQDFVDDVNVRIIKQLAALGSRRLVATIQEEINHLTPGQCFHGEPSIVVVFRPQIREGVCVFGRE